MPAADFAKMVPGLDFLQGLLKNAGSGLPDMSQWIAPTLDPDELEKRIEQLRTVQFWLEQNARMLATSIQALEVQRMTLSTLRTMNLPLDAIRDSLAMKPPAEAGDPPPRGSRRAKASSASAAASGSEPAGAAVDPMQWWSALTGQFTDLAAKALKEVPADAARQFAGAMAHPAPAGAKSAARKPAAARKAPPASPRRGRA